MKKRTKRINKAIALTWDSLQSHLPYTHGKPKKVQGDCDFHKKAIKEYAEIIHILARLY